MCSFKIRLEARGYQKKLIESTLSEVSFSGLQSAPKKQTKQTKGKIVPFVTTYHPGVKNLKQVLMQKWGLIKNQPLNGCSFVGFCKALQHFFSCLQQCKNLFLFYLCCMQFFSSNKPLQEIFFQNHPPPPSRVKWSAP